MAKKQAKKYETLSGREMVGVINGKVTGVRFDKTTKSYYYNHPQPKGNGKRVWLGRNKGYAARDWTDVIEAHHREQLQILPEDKIKRAKQISVTVHYENEAESRRLW